MHVDYIWLISLNNDVFLACFFLGSWIGLYHLLVYRLFRKILAAQSEQNLTQNIVSGGIMGTDHEFSDDPLVDNEQGHSSTELV